MRELVLSKRLQALCDLVTPGRRVVDVGCDHGLVDIYLVQKGISPGVLAMDVREGPLSRAREHVEMYGLGNYIETRMSDGLNAFCVGEARTLICAGMGGRLMQRILTESGEKAKSFDELILQPQSELSEFRRFLRKEGYCILQENILVEDGKYYFLLKVLPSEKVTPEEEQKRRAMHRELYRRFCSWGKQELPEAEWLEELEVSLGDRFGLQLLWERDPVLLEYLQAGLKNAREIAGALSEQDSDRARVRLLELQADIEQYLQALEFYRDVIGK